MRYPDGRLETVASTAQLVIDADDCSTPRHEGPCYDAVTVDAALRGIATEVVELRPQNDSPPRFAAAPPDRMHSRA